MTQRTESASGLSLPDPDERRMLREAKAMSREEVAAVVGVTASTVRAWETGRTAPRGRKRQAYAKLLAGIQADLAEAGLAKVRAGGPAGGAGPSGQSARSKAETPHGHTAAHARHRAAPRAAAKPPSNATDPAAPHPPPTDSAPTDSAPRNSAPTRPAPVVEPAPAAAAPETVIARAAALTPAEAFDALYAYAAAALTRQAYMLTGRRALSQEAVQWAFQQAWQRWPEVARDPDPVGWVRAAAYEYALSPWHRLRRAHKEPDPPPTRTEDRALLDALLDLPPMYRRTLLLYDGVGLDLPETAAETEASTPAAAGRLLHARAAVSERLPELKSAASLTEESSILHTRLTALTPVGPLVPPPARHVRTAGERRAQLWTRAAIGLTTVILAATLFTLVTAPTRYEPARAPGEAVPGVPPHMGPQPLTPQAKALRQKLRSAPGSGPQRLLPEPH
ncbi:helix-turn-helix domain-containing protein [Streptomyces sp. NPDC051219]|uniref:helix-turn-helix domain-containing protein n=1 Tax=Streptomyces sp. NPDC051219 TaxID=3155283 RepID=UPI00342ECEF6